MPRARFKAGSSLWREVFFRLRRAGRRAHARRSALEVCRALVLAVVISRAPTAAAPGDAAAGIGSPTNTLPPVIRSTLLWTQGDLISVEAAQAANANFVHTFPRPPKMRGLIPVPAEKEWLAKWAQQVAALHQAGIFVSASVGSTCFNPEIFRQNNLDPENYFARDHAGKPSSMLGGAYGKELMSSCYSNPDWIALLTENVLAFARAGFDGIWYDVGGYVDNAVLYCQCRHCQAGWREHLVSLQRDPEVPLPAGSARVDDMKWIDREFLRWRWAQWIRWEARVEAAVKREYPKFAFAHNMGVREGNDRGMHMFIQATTNLFDYVHWEEWGHGTAPYSDITSYLLGAAAGRGKPVMLVQNDKPARNPLQHQIFLAEGYASGGVPEFGTRHAGSSRNFLTFVAGNEPLYARSRCLANVAVVYSCWSQAVYAFPAKRWPAHWMGQLLLDRHIPFDYLVAENDLNPATLDRYKTIILPDQASMTDAQVRAVRSFADRGGNVIVTGQTGRFDDEMSPRKESLGESIAGRNIPMPARVPTGRGKAVIFADRPEETYWRQNPRDFAHSEKLSAPSPLAAATADAFDWVLTDTLPLKVTAAPTTVVLPRRQEDRILLHLVNYNVYPDGRELHPDHAIRIALALPSGSKAAKVVLVSPDFAGRKTITPAESADNVLHFTVDELRVYSVVVVELQK